MQPFSPSAARAPLRLTLHVANSPTQRKEAPSEAPRHRIIDAYANDRGPLDRIETMLELDAREEAMILGLSDESSDADIQSILEEIAEHHAVDWQSWPTWKSSAGWPPLLSWLALQYLSPAYEAMVSFAFSRAWAMQTDPARVHEVFEAFVGSIHALGTAASGGENAHQADMHARRGMIAMFIAVGPSAVRLAYVAMRKELAQTRTAWLDDAWRVSVAYFDRHDIGDATLTTSAVSERQTTL